MPRGEGGRGIDGEQEPGENTLCGMEEGGQNTILHHLFCDTLLERGGNPAMQTFSHFRANNLKTCFN